MHLPVYILAGGRSSRFGSDKARAVLDRLPLVERVCHLVEGVASSVTVVAEAADKYADLGLRTIGDVHPGRGPAGGLATALSDVREGWLMLCPCDAVVIRPAWLATLVEHAEAATQEVDAITFRDRYWQPMPGVYHVRGLAVVDRLAAEGSCSMQRLLDSVRSVALPLPSDWPARWQANTREELRGFEAGE